MTTLKTGYHHGDLRTALIDAGLHLTQSGGPDALTIREATRRVGVSPNAAYRHFVDREALLSAVATEIQHRMAARMARRHATDGTERLRAVGLGYIKFALDEPGWFTVAFFSADPVALSEETATAPPYLALVDVLDEMVRDGTLSPDRRAGAEWPCWSAVHGFAELALRGPLRHASRREVEALAARTVDDIIAGLICRNAAMHRSRKQ
ncbi:TetR/AcrR family transcriptional regulator [Mycobacterium marseillense]|uniref:TetR family transcriptional regulator n=1 Tax=Mycobacterium marseillense TaxID=701042 RepID=A0ABN6A0L8_9MYCO|nr:TetR/AcrR family transcriptional regulator [Mycobacterium marseillense]MCA2262135.1 TetR/AcrR family transcriptional regulator [Mycobacterium marseillense]MCV7405196.1 TetR/AcrR family transcriptional regulator [Mycobacterium marseillense]MDM3974199.1 TetR/AcrR family transcriptional regulator [Mycobacterium marseillense]OBJ71139.1 TetR family transcriptional regulator [Mycobacterium marseillense]ORA88084.1 TetR family transcriptional regulator [Mycobacterium marseillense]